MPAIFLYGINVKFTRQSDLGLSLKDDHSATFIPCGQQIPRLVEFHCRDDISWVVDREKNVR